MSTRGFVGIGTASDWSARYNHFDSYPTGLGPKVWAMAQQFLYDEHHLNGFAHRLLGFTDWRQMETGGTCEYCGRTTGQPHSINGRLFITAPPIDVVSQTAYAQYLQSVYGYCPDAAVRVATEDWPLVNNLRRTGYIDPDARYHQHDDGANPDSYSITPENANWLFLEWGYVIDPDTRQLHVFVGTIDTPITYRLEYIRADGSRDFYPSATRYVGMRVTTLDLTGPEPDWNVVEKKGYAARKRWARRLADCPDHPRLARLRQLPTVEVYDQREAVSS